MPKSSGDVGDDKIGGVRGDVWGMEREGKVGRKNRRKYGERERVEWSGYVREGEWIRWGM